MIRRRVLLVTLGVLLIVAGFVLNATSDGKLDRPVAVLVVFSGAVLVFFSTARPGREALARYWRKFEKK